MKGLRIHWLICTLFLTACCNDDAFKIDNNNCWRVIVSEAEDNATTVLPWKASFSSISVRIDGCGAETESIIVTSSDKWLSVASDTLAADSIVLLSTATNDTEMRRTAVLTFTDAYNPLLQASIEICQLSASDEESNGNTAQDILYIGYGYDVYRALESPMAVRTKDPVLDYQKMLELNNSGVYQVVQDCHLSRTDVKYVSANDIHSYGENLTQQQTNDNENTIMGCRENCIEATSFTEPSSGTLEQQNYGHGSLEKAVAARVVDRGALLDLGRRDLMPFSEQFNDRLRNIRKAQGSKRQQLVQQTLVDFGTHVIIQTDLGGRIDYTFTVLKESSFNTASEMQQEINYTFGRISDSDMNSNAQLSSSKSKSGAIVVKGGDSAVREVLNNDIKGLSPSGQIPPSHLTDWLATINYSDEPERDPNLEVIHFDLIPVWDIVPSDMRQDFLDITLSMVNRSDCALPASFMGTDIYEIEPGKMSSLFNFRYANDKSTLCRILYMDKEGEPVLQVCSEYVPKIRTDQRVTIVYPIYKQRIRMNQGLFIGDGVHQPAYVGFSGADCYVNPIKDIKPGSVIDKFYYVNGSLVLNNPTNATDLKGKNRMIQDDYLYLNVDANGSSAKFRHPIVKIGSKFWTRQDISHHMFFAMKPTGDSMDQLQDEVLYTRFQWEPNNLFMGHNSWIWGYAPNTFFDNNPNMKWYLPMSGDVQDLYAYLGFNPKALFPGQVSGWNAQFNGYYGMSDLNNENILFEGGKREMHYQGELNVICSKNTNSERNACIMVLRQDYSIQIIDDNTFKNAYRNEWRNNFYPVRAVRGYMFEYPTLKTIRENT